MVRYVGVQGRGNVFRRVEERELLARGEVGLHASQGSGAGVVKVLVPLLGARGSSTLLKSRATSGTADQNDC